MKKILWCGGSHLANFKTYILDNSRYDFDEQFKSEFAITAGGPFSSWAKNGGRIQALEDGSFKLFDDARMDTKNPVKVSDYDIIFFVGQYFQPSRSLNYHSLNKNQPLSENILNVLIEEAILRPPHPDYDKRILNEALMLFKKESEAFGIPLFFFADPLVLTSSETKRNADYVNNVPIETKKRFIRGAASFFRKKRIEFIMQDEITIDSNCFSTKNKYAQNLMQDDWHMNKEFWDLNFRTRILPAIRSV